MKRKLLFILLGLLIILIGFVTYKKVTKNDNNTTKINLAEVTHSPFYAPLYVAIENGYFKEEGLDVNLILTSGADKVSAAVLSGDVEIGFAGAESAIYIYNGGEKDYLQLFSSLTKRDGQFIVGRKNSSFNLEDLYEKEILVGRKGGMPALNFLNALKNNNIDLAKIKINYSVDFANLSSSFIGGNGDFVNLFEPNASLLEKENYGYILNSIGQLSGEMPYTAFYAKKSYIKDNSKIIDKFTNAILKGQQFVKENTEVTIAKVIAPQFLDNSQEDLSKIIKNYKDADSWYETPYISEEALINLENIMIDNNLLDDYVPYSNLVNNFYSE